MGTNINTHLITGPKAAVYGHAISMFRSVSKASVAELAKAVGLNYRTILRAETPEQDSSFSYVVVVRCATAFGLQLQEFEEFADALFGLTSISVERAAVFVKYLKILAEKGLTYYDGTSNTGSTGAASSGAATGATANSNNRDRAVCT